MYNIPVDKKPIIAASNSLGRISSLKLVFSEVIRKPQFCKQSSIKSQVFSYFKPRFHIDSSFSFSFSLTWTPEGWIICKNNCYELGMNNLYDSVNAIKIWKPVVNHTVVSYKSFNGLIYTEKNIWYTVRNLARKLWTSTGTTNTLFDDNLRYLFRKYRKYQYKVQWHTHNR